MDSSEALAAILNEMRHWPIDWRTPEEMPVVARANDVIKEYADRIEAVTEPGNMAAMREALKDIAFDCQYVAEGISDKDDYGRVALMRIRDKAHIALSTPARNCDVGNAADQTRRYADFCREYNCCERCPLEKENQADFDLFCDGCVVAFGQLPYKEGDDNGKGE